ncbi:hypothetical protein Ciccas_011005 [Cichlidogyrus casuarinus]|uniref:Uncharacterized protein n=1 Tax=Cichlidogyrus casuarinus TaxID=1844966 RepID=A0ABD2PT55_9PLAT
MLGKNPEGSQEQNFQASSTSDEGAVFPDFLDSDTDDKKEQDSERTSDWLSFKSDNEPMERVFLPQ